MIEGEIQFHVELEAFELDQAENIKLWLSGIGKSENKVLGNINYIFCSDEYLLQLNKQFLGHDYYTDILSFPQKSDPIEGDIFISIDRVRENAESFETSFQLELYRVISHGLLHFMGYEDHEEEDKILMRSKEDLYLSKITF
jgi:probable rRNA maturation factor